jgi:sugar lactone lactonase YvrE
MKSKCYSLLLPLFVLLMATGAKAQLINTIAGTGVAGSLSGGGPATNAQFEGPNGIAVDQYGNVFIADSGNNVIRMVNSSGMISTVAGGGTTGLLDGHPALEAELVSPTGVAVDTAGNIFIADFGDNRIRKVIKATGVIITVAGGGLSTADGVPAVTAKLSGPYGVRVNKAGDVYIADRDNNVVRVVVGGIINTVAGTFSSGLTLDGGPATNAELSLPAGVAVDVIGDIYFADQANNVVRKVDVAGNITTIAGNNMMAPGYTGDGGPATKAQLSQPCGVAVDASLNVYIADYGNNVIREVKFTTGAISTVVGNAANGGTSGSTGDGSLCTNIAVKLHNPCGIWYSAGTLYIADQGNNKIRAAVLGGTISTIAGQLAGGFGGDGGSALTANLNGPTAVTYDAALGNLYIADAGNNVIRMVNTTSGIITTVAGNASLPAGYSGDAGPATNAQLNNPTGVAFDATTGNIYIADNGNSEIRKVYMVGSGFITSVAGDGTTHPGYYGEGTPATLAKLANSFALACDVDGDVFISDTHNCRIREIFEVAGPLKDRIYTVAGNLSSVCGYGGIASYVQLKLPSGVCMSSTGIVFIADQGNNVIREIDAIGVIHTIAGTGVAGYSGDGVVGGATAAMLNAPYAVTYDDSMGYLYIADAYNNVIRRLAVGTGTITTFAGNNGVGGFGGDGLLATNAATKLFGPTGVDLDKYHNLFIADKFNNRVRRVDFLTNVITTIAGTGTYGFLADGGSALLSDLNAPYATTYDSLNKALFIADRNNNIIRRVALVSGLITTYAGTGIAGFSGEGGPAVNAQIDGPISLALDKNLNLFFTDQGNNVIRRIDYAAKTISVIAGQTGPGGVGFAVGAALSSKFYYPTGICIDHGSNNMYIADGNNNVVIKLSPLVGGTTSVYAGTGVPDSTGDGGSPTVAKLNDPIGVVNDPANNLLIADFGNNTVRKVNTAGTTITRFAGNDTMGYSGDNGLAIHAELRMPTSVASDASGNIFVADMGNYRIRLVNGSGNIKTVAGNGTAGYSGDGGAAPLAQINNAFGVSVDTTGNYYLADRDNNVIRKVTTVLIAKLYASVTALCQDSCVIFSNATIGNTDSIRWTTNDPMVTMSAATGDTNTICFNAAGVYTVTLTSWYHGQKSVVDTGVTVVATPYPVIYNTPGTGNVLVSGAYTTYQWYRNGSPIIGATTASYTSVITGTFTVTVDSAGCIGTSVGVYVNPGALGLTSAYTANSFWLSRQDNNTAILHAAQPLNDDLEIGIFDATGRDILDDKWKQGSSSLQINGASLPPGLYVIRLSNDKTSSVLKWLKD